MIAFACAITSPTDYRRFAEPGIRLAAEPDSEVLAFASTGSIFRSYNTILDRAAKLDDLEALVLVHQDAEIVDPDFCSKLRRALSDPDVGVVGCVGAVGVRSIAWWEGSITLASFTHRYEEMGGGEFPAFSWKDEVKPPFAQLGEVDTIDGFVMGLSPDTVRETRFDESLGKLHGYDFDFCLQVREAGRKVVTADVRAIHHRTLELVSEFEIWVEGHIDLAEKWDGRWPGREPEAEWKRRARRAEAEREAARTFAYSSANRLDAEVRALESEMAAMTGSPSWRVTAPLRWVNRVRRR
jgi:glycosyl transferase family 2